LSDRKYRHKGYQDSGSKPYSPPSNTPREFRPERVEGAPRGRTAGGFGPEAFKCSKCGNAQRALGLVEIEFDSVCEKCQADLHSCWNCKNFDTMTRWECRESPSIPARVSPKDLKNQCTMFMAKMVADLSADKGTGMRAETPDDARKAFEALFKK
jgi:hypothetical protein